MITTSLVIIKGLDGTCVLSNEHCTNVEIDETESASIRVTAPAHRAFQISFEE